MPHYHLPERIDVDATLDTTTADRVESAVRAALRRAIAAHEGRAGASRAMAPPTHEAATGRGTARGRASTAPPEAPNAEPTRDRYRVPSYDGDGDPVAVPVVTSSESNAAAASDASGGALTFEGETTRSIRARVVNAPPPFDGATVLRFAADDYVRVQSTRHAVAGNVLDAAFLGDLLFSTTGFVLAARVENETPVYYVAALHRAVTLDDFRGIRNAPDESGVRYLFDPSRVDFFDRFENGFHVKGVFLQGGKIFLSKTLSGTQALQQELDTLERLLSPGRTSSIPADQIQSALFAPIDALLDAEQTEQAADRIALLDEDAFAYLDLATKLRYLQVLVDANTLKAEERAIVALIRSLESRGQLIAIRDALVRRGVRDDFLRDLDDQLWAFLGEVGRRFADPFDLSPDTLIALARELGLLPPRATTMLHTAARRMGPNTLVMDGDALAELRSLLSVLVRFVTTTVSDLVGILVEPDAFFRGLAQLVEMAFVVGLAANGHEPSRQQVSHMVDQVGAEIGYVIQGARLFGVQEQVLRRIKYALVVEIASMFVGVGEVRAAVGLAQRARQIGTLLTGVARGSVALARTTRRTASLLRSLHRLTDDAVHVRDMARAFLHLPDADLARARRLLDVATPPDTDLHLLAERISQIDRIRRVAGAIPFGTKGALQNLLAAGLTNREIRTLLDLVDDGDGMSAFVRVVARFREGDLTGAVSRGMRTFDTLARHAAVRSFADTYGVPAFLTLDRIAGNDTGRLRRFVDAFDEMAHSRNRIERHALVRALERQRSAPSGAPTPELDALRAAEQRIRARSGGPLSDADLRRLATVAPGVRTVEALIAGLASDPTDGPFFRRLSRAAFDRLFDRVPNPAKVAGQLVEEFAAGRRRGGLASDPDLQLIEGHRITDPSGRELTDGIVVRRNADGTLQVEEIIEAKAGPASAEGLSRSSTSSSSLSDADRTERLRVALDEVFEGQDAQRQHVYNQARQEVIDAIREETPDVTDAQLAERADEIRLRTHERVAETVRTQRPGVLEAIEDALPLSEGGQVRRDLERLLPALDEDTVTIHIDGQPTSVRVSMSTTRIRVATPDDVDVLARVRSAFEHAGRGLDVQSIDVGLSTDAVRRLARRLIAEYTIFSRGASAP